MMPAEVDASSPSGVVVKRVEEGLLDRLFPRSFVGVSVYSGIFIALIVMTATTWGLSFGRFETRALSCYDHRTYWPKDNITDKPFCAVASYPYRLVESNVVADIMPWLMYLVHQLGQWTIMRLSQLAKDRGEIGWAGTAPRKGSLVAESEEPSDLYKPNIYAKWMFGLNMGMTILKFVNTHLFYDGLGNTVPEVSALYSVAIWLVIMILVRMPDCGLFFGFWTSFDNRLGIGHGILPFIRKYHGYAISFGLTYNYWYHPVEGSLGFCLGYLYQFLMMMQSCFLYHPLHKNKVWTVMLQLGLVPHGVVAGLFFANGSASAPYTFGVGFIMTFVVTHMHIFDFTRLQKGVIAVGCVGAAVLIYVITGRSLSHMTEVLQNGLFAVTAPMVWLVWLLIDGILCPFRGLVKAQPWLTGVLWFMIWAVQMGLFVSLGPAGGKGHAS